MADRNIEKSHAPSILSFDSGYASHAGLDPLFDEDGELRLDDFCDEIKTAYTTSPPAPHSAQSKLHVFTNLGTSSATPNAFLLPEIHDDEGGCLQCALWEITNPGENLRCEECRQVPGIEVEVVEPGQLFLNGYKGKQPVSFTGLDIRRKGDGVPTRCSACELARLIDPTGHDSCPYCSGPGSNSPSMNMDQTSSSSFQECRNEFGRLPENAVELASPDPSLLSPVSPRSPRSPSSKVRRSRAGRNSKLPLSALNRLQTWLDAHQDNPYPTAEDKKQLALDCGITEKQVTTWFTNARARQLNPLERWASSGSGSEDDGEGVKEEDIERAAAAVGLGLGPGLAESGFTYLSGNGSSAQITTPHRRAASVSGSSAFSGGLGRASGPTPSRRGKKKDYRRSAASTSPMNEFGGSLSPISPVRQQQPTSNPASVQFPVENPPLQPEQEMWQCTFCRRALAPKSWRRHEETQHRPRSQWTCMLYGPRLSFPARANTNNNSKSSSATAVSDNRGSRSYCAFCMMESPPESHFQTHHRISDCAKRAPKERTFFRPDHLRQHVKNFHHSKLLDIAQVRWKTKGDEGDCGGEGGYICGFCGDKLSDWDKRETHISNHFKDGWTMDRWRTWPQTSTRAHTEPEVQIRGKKSQKDKVQDPESNLAMRLSRTFSFGRKAKGSQPSHQSCEMDMGMGLPGTFNSGMDFVPQTQAQQMFMNAPMLTTSINTEPLWSGCDFNDMNTWNLQIPTSNQQYLPLSSTAGDMNMDMTAFDPSMALSTDYIPDLPNDLGNQIDYHGPWRQA